MYLLYSASEICAPIYSRLKVHGNAMVLPLGFTIVSKARNYTYTHAYVFTKDCTRRFSIKIRLFTYTATLTKPTWLSHFCLTNPDLCLIKQKWCSMCLSAQQYLWTWTYESMSILWKKCLKTGTILNKKHG